MLQYVFIVMLYALLLIVIVCDRVVIGLSNDIV